MVNINIPPGHFPAGFAHAVSSFKGVPTHSRISPYPSKLPRKPAIESQVIEHAIKCVIFIVCFTPPPLPIHYPSTKPPCTKTDGGAFLLRPSPDDALS